ncbi:MAG: ester cyclase [Bacteroidales bacterium]
MKKCIAPLFLFILIGINAQTKLEKQNEVLARSFVESWSADKYHDLPSLFADQCEYIEIPSGRSWKTPDAILGYAEATLSGIPDCHTRVVTVVVNENIAAVEWMMEGTNTKGWPNIPASGKSFSLKVLSIMEIEDGLISKNRDYWDVETFVKAVSE